MGAQVPRVPHPSRSGLPTLTEPRPSGSGLPRSTYLRAASAKRAVRRVPGWPTSFGGGGADDQRGCPIHRAAMGGVSMFSTRRVAESSVVSGDRSARCSNQKGRPVSNTDRPGGKRQCKFARYESGPSATTDRLRKPSRIKRNGSPTGATNKCASVNIRRRGRGPRPSMSISASAFNT